MQKRRWEDLSATERICMGVAAGVQFALLGAALAAFLVLSKSGPKAGDSPKREP